MIDAQIARFIEGDVMTIAASRDAAMRAEIARVVGTRHCGAGRWESFVSAAQWPGLVADLGPGAPLALTFVRPADYLAYQIKAETEEVAPAGPDDLACARGYIDRMTNALAALGVGERQIAAWLCGMDVVRIRWRPGAVFLQTPGPAAGSALA